MLVDLNDCVVAYRKAKAEAFYENTHFHALAFAEYERDLISNLRKLLARLKSNSGWTSDARWLGGYAYTPKGIELPEDEPNGSIHFRLLDPTEEWKRRFAISQNYRLRADFRLVITPTVDFQVVSALWIMKVGAKLDAVLNSSLSYGNRLRRQPRESDWDHPHATPGGLNLDCVGLFVPYFSAYRKWRENGLNAMRGALEEGDRIVAITMDIQKFYHRVSPRFVIQPDYLAKLPVPLTAEEIGFTQCLISAIETWYRSTPDFEKRPKGSLPVGLSASKVLSNVLLAEVDALIWEKLKPVYYGRYVDDFFIVMNAADDLDTGSAVMKSLAASVPELLSFFDDAQTGAGLRITLPYASDSELLLAGSKQKIFNLSGAYGLDLIAHINDQIRKQSSEHRLLPLLPERGEEMASRALLAQPSSTLEADALRKADVISVRRLGLALLLRDAEAYARDLPPQGWLTRRQEFYALIKRHVLTPQGFFDFFSYAHRAFALMIACGDHSAAQDVVIRLVDVANVIEETTTAGTDERSRFELCKAFYGRALLQAGLQATTVPHFRWALRVLRVFQSLRQLAPDLTLPRTTESARRISTNLLYADFGRHPYRMHWLAGARSRRKNPSVPSSIQVRRTLRLGAVRSFRKQAGLKIPYWPAIAFPTRPLGLSEITMAAPALLHSATLLRGVLFAFRGARTQRSEDFGLIATGQTGMAPELLVRTRRSGNPRVALPSLYTSDKDWLDAARGKPRLALHRYERIRRLINSVCREMPRVHYLIFPECSLPRQWAGAIAHKLAQQKISLIAGLEYRKSAQGLRNEALISLTTEWSWYATSVLYTQEKSAPAHEERRKLRRLFNAKLHRPKDLIAPVYVHGGVCLGVVICSDLTTAAHRLRFQGAVDVLVVLEWNADVETFSFLVESTAHDLHGYVVQVNNRQFGDSRIRAPRKKDYERDIVRVKGGMADYFVVAEVDVAGLRGFQRKPIYGKDALFKPLPIGFKMSSRRKSSTTEY
jgi:Reverse transcriptase (RNA-dependent DNA polymerase)